MCRHLRNQWILDKDRGSEDSGFGKNKNRKKSVCSEQVLDLINVKSMVIGEQECKETLVHSDGSDLIYGRRLKIDNY